jgi:hypothetical protein
MKRLIPMFLLMTLQLSAQKQKSINETFEWNHSWIITQPQNGVSKRLLLIGDSHVERYFPVVTEMLKGEFLVCKISTSKSLGDPAFLNQLKGLLGNFSFDAIFFNNGLHGVAYSTEAYAKDLPPVLKLLRKNSPAAKIFWVNTIARRVPDKLDQFDMYQHDVVDRNKAVLDFCTKRDIPVLDFSKMSLENLSYYSRDGIHFNETGVKAQAQMIADKLRAYNK